METSILNLSDLTSESPLSLITEKLETRIDTRRLRAVCHNLRKSIREPPKTTIPDDLKIIPVPFGYFSAKISHYTLVESTIYAIQPLEEIPNPLETAATWFVKVEEQEFGPVKLKHTLCEFQLQNISEELPMSLNLLDYRVKEIAKAYELKPVCRENQETADHVGGNQMSFEPEKVIVSEDFDVMVMHNKGMTLSVLRYGDKNWLNVQDSCVDRYIKFDDVVYYDQKFYAVNRNGHTLSFDCKTLAMSPVTFPKDNLGNGKTFLVKKSGEGLFLVVKWSYSLFIYSDYQFANHHYFPARFSVYKLANFQWDELHGYGDRVFFLGHGCSFSVMGNEFPGCEKNSVYFSEKILSAAVADDAHLSPRPGIFRKDDLSVRPLSALPGRAQLFWPPPAWVKPN
ncbi:F-box protein SKIP23-like [Melia azedarach]|uniref:F-box protein SKIP23-like n=1 Tax=Melia azedarach TaxID=155640 RepID=A0ACC1XT14_MELAZ|nr:F-box protein SKIP23-like [Melia azedarach]